MVPDEALNYADSVVIGEAESIWPKVIEDFESGNLQRIYKGEWTDLKGAPKPRRDLFKPHKYLIGSIYTTRGCPFDCEFCSVSAFNGRRYRQRPVEEVLDELEEIPQKFIFFMDDNLVGFSKKDQERAIEFFQGMIESFFRE
jgi:radical SAM superfamily enzyme YgiQ (UPF0313 family)